MDATARIPPEALAKAAECFRVLAHPARLRIIETVLDKRATVGELAEACELPPAMTSAHLRLMQRCGLLVPERDGRFCHYRAANDCLADLMNCIRHRFGGETHARRKR
jgi:DNA-binding transcriptional ArsR family regulator